MRCNASWSRDNIVGVVARQLADRVIVVPFPEVARDFSVLQSVQTSSVAHPASCSVGTGSSVPGHKAAEA